MSEHDAPRARTKTMAEIYGYSRLASKVLGLIKQRNVSEPREGPTFTISEAAKLVRRSTSAIRMAEGDGRLPPQERNELGRRKGYTLTDLDRMRNVFETRPWRESGDKPCIIACQNFKGGVGKSTVSVHLAQYLAMRGYRVLMIDADAQASTTMMFGIIPDQDLGEDETLYAVLRNNMPRNIRSVIRKTHYHGLDLIPANLFLYNAEYEIAGRMRATDGFTLMGLRSEINKVCADYDVVILDPPPALGMISLSVLSAASALLIPMPPSIIDFASTTSFLNMMNTTLEQLADMKILPDYDFINLVMSKSGPRDNARDEVLAMTKEIFGRTVMETNLKMSAEVGHATSRLMSVYDLPSPATSYSVHQRCVGQFDDFGREVERMIRETWTSTTADEV